MAWIFGMKIKASGPRPQAPFFLVSNHLSYTDIFLVCAVCPAWFISKSEVASWPGIGALTRIGPTIYINREMRKDVKRMNQLIGSLVKNREAVGFFPEGTTTDGEEVLPFKPSLFQPAIEMNLPVTTAAIAYVTREGMPPASEIIAWYGDTKFAPHVGRLLGQPGFTAHILFGSEKVTADDRKILAKKSHTQVCELLSELKGARASCPTRIAQETGEMTSLH
jgi:1-acyl-sn-glycerol-3-phosphate acyltransferase